MYAKYTGKEEKNFDDSFRQHQKQEHRCHFYYIEWKVVVDVHFFFKDDATIGEYASPCQRAGTHWLIIIIKTVTVTVNSDNC